MIVLLTTTRSTTFVRTCRNQHRTMQQMSRRLIVTQQTALRRHRQRTVSLLQQQRTIINIQNDYHHISCSQQRCGPLQSHQLHQHVSRRMISQDLFSRWFASDTTDIAVDDTTAPKTSPVKPTTSTTTTSPSSFTVKNNNDDDIQQIINTATTTNTNTTDVVDTPEQYRSDMSTLIEPNTKSHSQKTLDNLPITFADISRAEVAIRGGVTRTTCEKSHFISELCNANVYFKNEFRQFTGSFKERGARNAILKLLRDKGGTNGTTTPLRGVIAASAGNHALAMAYHGQQLGVPVTVVMPTTAPLAKVDKCRKFGARIISHGQHIGEAKIYADTLVASEGIDYINGYDDPPILAGAGTIGVEIIDDVPNVDVVVVPVGGAGLIAGIACAIKTLKPEVKVIGVEPEFCASFTAALRAGRPVPAPFTPTLADGLAVPIVGAHAFEVARHYVDECVLTSEKCISIAVLRLIENEKVVVEGGGAAGLAAVMPGGALDRPDMKGKNIVIPLCGGNIDTTLLGRVLDRGLAADQRLVNFYATVSDRPGGISGLTTLLSEHGASIKDIYHERAWLHTNVDQVQVKCVVELQGKEHGKRVREAMISKGYHVVWNTEL